MKDVIKKNIPQDFISKKKEVEQRLKTKLQALAAETSQKWWGVVDFETSQGKKIVYWFLLLSDGTFKGGWRGHSEFLNYLAKLNHKTLYLYAHCGARYDYRFLFKKLAGECQVKANKNAQILVIKWNNIHFLDSYLLLNRALDSLPLTKEEAKIKEWGRSLITSQGGIKNMSKEQIAEYCQNDVRVLFRILKDFFTFFAQQGVDIIGKPTIGSAAFYTWKKQFPEFYQSLPNLTRPCYENLYNFVQPYYLGGFCGMANQALYRIPRHNSYKYDVNSMFPDIMAKENLPYGLPIKHLTWEKNCASCWNKEKKEYFRPHSIPQISVNRIPFGFIRVEIENLKAIGSAKKIPFVPVRNEKGTTFCPQKIGKLEGVYFSEYLKLILKNYTYSAIRYKEAYVFNKAKGFFAEWVAKYQQLKVASKEKFYSSWLKPAQKLKWKQQYYFAKMMLNSLYGKFGQRKEVKELAWKEGKSPSESGITYHKEGQDYHLSSTEIKGFGFNYVPLASAIASYSRIRLVETMQSLGTENVLYWDTDCLVSKIAFPAGLVHPTLMGQWKLEAKYHTFVSFSAKAYYGKSWHSPPDWAYKEIGGDQFKDQKINPVKLLLKGLVMEVKEHHYTNRGVEIKEGQLRRVLSGYFNQKNRLRKKRVQPEYFWHPIKEVSSVGWGLVKNEAKPFVNSSVALSN